MALTPRRNHHKLVPGEPDRRTPIVIGSELPADTLRQQKTYSRVRSGKLRLKQTAWCEALVADWFLMSMSALRRKYHTDHATIVAVVKAYSEAGKLPDSRTIALRKASRLQELSDDCLREHYEAGRVTPRDAWIGWGIATDKIANLTSGVIPGTDGKTQVEIDANATNAVLDVFERLKALKANTAAKPPPQLTEGGGGVTDGSGADA